MIVEDSEDDEKLLLEALHRAGFEIVHECVDNAPDMKAALDRREWDIVVSDYNLPRFTGPAALDLLRGRGLDTPFIIVSGTVGEEVAVEVMRRGANDYLMKSNYLRLGAAVERELREAADRRARRKTEVELLKAQARLGQLLEHSPAVIYSLKLADQSVAPTLVSENITRLLGFTVEDVTHSEWWRSHVHPEDRERATDLAGLLADGSQHREYRIQSHDGSYHWIEDHQRLVRSAGKAEEVVGVWTDITERKLAEAALQESQARLNLAIQASNIGTWDWNLLTNEVYFSPEWKQQIGYTDAELPNEFSAWETRLHPEDRERILATVKAYIVEPGPGYDVDFRLRHKDGSYRWINTRATLTRDATGRPIRMLGCHVDITERKRTNDQLREQASLLDKAQDAILVRDTEQRIAYWNKSAERIYGWTAEEAVGVPVETLLKVDAQAFQQARETLNKTGEWSGELSKVAKDGRALIVEARWTLVRDGTGQPKSILDISSDITEKKKAEAQFLRNQRMESIGTLAGGIAHDLNNVLAPIMMSIQILKFKTPGAEDQNLLTALESSCRRGADLVKQVLGFARGVEGERVTVNLQHLMRELMQIMRDTFPKNIAVCFSPSRDLWMVTGDPTQLHQVFLNLCVNARDAMPQGGSLSITMENVVIDETYAAMNPDFKPGPHVVCKVTDTGTGIPPGIREKVFEPFFTTKEIGKGTGLGLSTTLAIVKSHGGFLNLHSEMRKGTTFKVYLPAAATEAAAESVAVEQTRLPRGRGELVLVVDDEEGIRKIAQLTLERFGYRVVQACHGAEAVSIYARCQHEIAVVLTDMAMPIMDGPAMIVALQTMNPNVKIIGSSGLTSNQGMVNALGAGVVHFIPKPYGAETMLKTLHEVLHGVALTGPANH